MRSEGSWYSGSLTVARSLIPLRSIPVEKHEFSFPLFVRIVHASHIAQVCDSSTALRPYGCALRRQT